ncbi:8-amino-7-oxononanoate synthase [Sphingomonas sp. CGMCC 1.13654]|uniref:8-amino-7-oxononanoate synthase n=1 Tax=Sphingomonas chungangi TaxID=2683589 RepID=A0A838L3K7_9SPHN|nr:8-amino-7-oxononanoate synthase [Sphingomonas chungangi]MBA2933122.1 8-amino-7-oxononanoate synthase [Sphingomonas chungangi]MVW56742.1 aminotransferase class I/II-fold pyridoxal phosphate-dependent enzyme [Sphingomonas chungangi]
MAALDTHLATALERIDARHERRGLKPAALAADGRLERDGATLVDFSSNDYLGLARHPLLIERAAEWAARYGAGAGASRLVTGTHEAHLAVEARIAAFKGAEAALLFPSGWHCNAAVLAALLKAAPGTLLFTDRLIHASLHAGAAGHRQIRFRHNDLDHLEELLAANDGGPKLIVTESVFSMDGDRADIARLVEIARAHDAFLYIDEAHATGVLGPQGRGLSAEHPGADLVMGTFSKAMGCFGAYVAGSRLLIDYLVNACGGFIFSTAPPPAMLGAIDAALELVPGMEAERARLAQHGEHLRARLNAAGIGTAESSTQIVPAIVGEAEAALALAAALQGDGLLAAAIRPPTVPPGTSRLRLALRATHAASDIDALADAIVARMV